MADKNTNECQENSQQDRDGRVGQMSISFGGRKFEGSGADCLRWAVRIYEEINNCRLTDQGDPPIVASWVPVNRKKMDYTVGEDGRYYRTKGDLKEMQRRIRNLLGNSALISGRDTVRKYRMLRVSFGGQKEFTGGAREALRWAVRTYEEINNCRLTDQGDPPIVASQNPNEERNHHTPDNRGFAYTQDKKHKTDNKRYFWTYGDAKMLCKRIKKYFPAANVQIVNDD